MTLQRYRVGIANFPGAPGVMTLYFSTAVTDFTAVRTFCIALATVMPNGLQFQFPTTVDQINEATGTLTGSASTAAQSVVTSVLSAATYSGTSGAVVRWQTGLIQAGKRVVGRSFIVPLAGSMYANDGTLASTTQTTIQSAANTMLATYSDGVKVWSRPNATRAGAMATVISALVPDLAAVLRSRRI